jgi:hypothetical protein
MDYAVVSEGQRRAICDAFIAPRHTAIAASVDGAPYAIRSTARCRQVLRLLAMGADRGGTQCEIRAA